MCPSLRNKRVHTFKGLVVNVNRLLFDAITGSVSELAGDVMNLLTVLCSSELVQSIGISSVIYRCQLLLNFDSITCTCRR